MEKYKHSVQTAACVTTHGKSLRETEKVTRGNGIHTFRMFRGRHKLLMKMVCENQLVGRVHAIH